MTIPARMHAAILVKLNNLLVVDEVELPAALECGQVLVKVNFSGICGSQLGEIAGVKGPDRYLPHLLGHEGSGTVLECGSGVRNVRPGDHVVLHWMRGNGIEAVPPRYAWHGRTLHAGWVTTFNEYAVVSENRLTPVPASLDGRIAALFGCAVTTGLGVVCNNARIKMGDSVVVFGAGGVGLNVIQGASLSGALPIIGIDIHDSRLELAHRLGATHVINSRTQDLRKGISALLGPSGADVAIDNTGNPAMIQLAYEVTGSEGRVVLVGVPGMGDNVSIHTLPLHFGKTLIGSHGGDCNPTGDIPRYLKLYESGNLELSSIITHEFSLDGINDAIDQIRSGAIAGRCMIAMHRS